MFLLVATPVMMVLPTLVCVPCPGCMELCNQPNALHRNRQETKSWLLLEKAQPNTHHFCQRAIFRCLWDLQGDAWLSTVCGAHQPSYRGERLTVHFIPVRPSVRPLTPVSRGCTTALALGTASTGSYITQGLIPHSSHPPWLQPMQPQASRSPCLFLS